ncbi:MAG: GerMN domain-containing protein [Clostridia bacterium]|nr:GerMN domain-containing protein [Clostridia bacterium]
MKFKFLFASVVAIVILFASTSCGVQKNSVDADNNTLQNDEYNPVSSLTLTDVEAVTLNNSIKVKVYYKTLRGDKLCSETKLLQFTDKDRKVDVLASKILELALSGPSNTSLVKTLPEGTKLNSLKIKNGVAYVDFNEAFTKGLKDSSETVFIAYSVANTLTEFKNVNRVAITCNGNKIESSACNFSDLLRNTEIITDIESALPKTDYSENVFLEIELE